MLLSGLSAPAARAQDLEGRWGVGFELGMMKFTEGYWDYSTLDQSASLTLRRGLSKRWTFEAALKYGYVRPTPSSPGEDGGWTGQSSAPLYTPLWQPEVKLQHRFAPDKWISPYLGFGVGFTSWKVVDKAGESVGLFPGGDPVLGYNTNRENVELKGTDFTFSLELMVDFFVSDHVSLNLGGRYHLMPGNKTDNIGMSYYWGPDHVDANTAIVEGALGVSYWFGASDRDHDGVPNNRDGCPDDPEDADGFNDLDGCPEYDNDRDGVLDVDDDCPTRPEDMDGFQDEDGCPDPDNDADGIVDARDGCPDEAEDMDGFQDEDGCPDPDNDQDGVLDADDLCPDTPAGAAVNADGCTERPVLEQTLVLEGVSFRTGSAELTPESITVLAEVAVTLQAWPEKHVEVRGHTDNTGSPEGNRDLSHRRAMSVRDSLIQLGVSPARLTAVGYGQDFPVADNSTADGRRMNRRVEVQILD